MPDNATCPAVGRHTARGQRELGVEHRQGRTNQMKVRSAQSNMHLFKRLGVALAVLLSGCVAAGPTPGVGSAPPSSSPNSVAPSASALALATPKGATYASGALGYRLELPPGWQRAPCLSNAGPAGSEWFTPQPDRAGFVDMGGVPNALSVSVHANPKGLTPREWARGAAPLGSRIEDVIIDGRQAARGGIGVYQDEAIVVPDADRMFVVGYLFTDEVRKREAQAVLGSFHVLTSAERLAAPTPTPDSTPARSAESVADTLADGFARRDLGVLGSVLAPCVMSYNEGGGPGGSAGALFLDTLRDQFARGLSVSVKARPLRPGLFLGQASGAFAGSLTLDATWAYPGEPPRRIDLLLAHQGDTWSWVGTVIRFGN